MDVTKLSIEAGDVRFQIEGSEKFVVKQAAKHRSHIEAILKEQLEIIKRGKPGGKRRGRPPGPASLKKAALNNISSNKTGAKRIGRPPGSKNKTKTTPAAGRPGRRPQIVRSSNLKLDATSAAALTRFIAGLAAQGKLGKDATVFAIAYFLCKEVFGADRFSAGDVSAAHGQIGKIKGVPNPGAVDVVQMLRNLAASSIGKMWVARNSDGTFSLTDKGKSAGARGQFQRPRGRKAAVKAPNKTGRGPGRPPKIAKRGPGRPPKIAKRGPGRPPKIAKRGPGRPPKIAKRGPGRPPKIAKRGPGRPPKIAKRGPGRPPKIAKRGPGRPPKIAKRGPGRPPKIAKRGPGRPPKVAA